MNEIICPNCKKAFKVDEAGFADILKQVRDHQFEEELNNRLTLAEREKDSAVKLAEATIRNSLQEQLAKKDNELTQLKANSAADLADKLSKKEAELAELKSKKEAELAEMKSRIQNAEMDKRLSVSEAVKLIEKERDTLANNLRVKETETQLLEKSIKEQFNNTLMVKEETIKMKDDEIARLKDFKQKLSTKMVGETLEQHCESEFNKLRATAFQNAYFEKDNDSSGGSKGDSPLARFYKACLFNSSICNATNRGVDGSAHNPETENPKLKTPSFTYSYIHPFTKAYSLKLTAYSV